MRETPRTAVAAVIRVLLAVLLGVILGGVMTWGAMRGCERSFDEGVGPPGDVAIEPEILRLREELDAQESRVRRLEAELAIPETPETPAPSEDPEPADRAEASTDSASDEKPWFNAAALEAEGWRPHQVERIRLRWERLQMENLEIDNQRARKVPGWQKLGKQKFQSQVDARRDLGDEDYEAMRFAAGEPNRVVLTELLEISPAAEAGLLPGDEVISYDGQRVFTASALKFLTEVGEKGEPTEIRILRGNQEQRFFLPRGPLGTRLEAQVRPPYP